MSNVSQLSVALQAAGTGGPCDAATVNSLVLEQIEPRDDLTMRDIEQMYALARSGVSARTYKPAYKQKVKIGPGFVRFAIDFYVWTIPIDLSYQLSTSLGNISPARRITEPQEFSAVFELSRGVALGWSMYDLSYEWKTPLIDALGNVYYIAPIITYKNGALCKPDPFFGEARIRCRREGNRHTLTCQVPTVDDSGNNLTVQDINITVTARWQDSRGETQTTPLKLKISDAVKSAFEICQGTDAGPHIICHQCSGSGADGSDGGMMADVYFNTCNGDVLDVHKYSLDDAANGKWCLPTSGL